MSLHYFVCRDLPLILVWQNSCGIVLFASSPFSEWQIQDLIGNNDLIWKGGELIGNTIFHHLAAIFRK